MGLIQRKRLAMLHSHKRASFDIPFANTEYFTLISAIGPVARTTKQQADNALTTTLIALSGLSVKRRWQRFPLRATCRTTIKPVFVCIHRHACA